MSIQPSFCFTLPPLYVPISPIFFRYYDATVHKNPESLYTFDSMCSQPCVCTCGECSDVSC